MTVKLSLLPHYLYMRDIIDCPLHWVFSKKNF